MNYAEIPGADDDNQKPIKPSASEMQRSQVFDVNQGVDSPMARWLAWLGNHFFAVTLVLTGALLTWAIGFNGR